MPKYYVESGWVRMVLDAKDPEQAGREGVWLPDENKIEFWFACLVLVDFLKLGAYSHIRQSGVQHERERRNPLVR